MAFIIKGKQPNNIQNKIKINATHFFAFTRYKNMKAKFTLIELVIAITISLIIFRYIWAKELIESENALIQSIGLPAYSKYVLTIPLVALLYYSIFQRESFKAKIEGRHVVRKGVLIFALCGVAIAIIYIGSI